MCQMKMTTVVSLGLLQLLCTFCAVLSQAPLQQQQSTPVPILQQINRQNEDGSYTYGYKNADGSYKIETKSATGEIEGEYGYIDETGKARQVKYGASSSRGFEPAGPGITVPPPTLHVQDGGNSIEDYDDGQYREDPGIYYKTEQPLVKKPTPSLKIPIVPQRAAQPPVATNFRYQTPLNNQPAAPAQYNWYRPENTAAAAAASYNPAIFQGHPATNFDPFTGSYTINYTG